MERYLAHVVKVIDGDTFKCYIELNFNVILKAKVRLLDINCPEKNTPEGVKAKEWVKEKIENKNVYLETDGFGKYGRVLARVYLSKKDEKNLNTILLEQGMAVPYAKLNLLP